MALHAIKDLGPRSIPFIDWDGRTLWSLSYSTANNTFDGIDYSHDYGDSWINFVKFGSQPRPFFYSLFADSRGNLYYSIQNALMRVDGKTKNISRVIDFVSNPPGFPANSYAHVHMWGLAEDLQGNIYCPQYGMADDTVAEDAVQIQYLWKSRDKGLTWERKDWFIDIRGVYRNFDGDSNELGGFRHIHNLKCNPYNGKMYISVGDTYRASFVSTDGFESMPVLIDEHDAPTGLTFTREAVWWGLDYSPASIVRYVEGTPFSVAFSPPYPYEDEIYILVAAGDNELWFTQPNWTHPEQRSGLHKLTKAAGVNNPWVMETIIDGTGTKHNDYYWAIATNNFGVIPSTFPFVYVQHITHPSAIHAPNQILRVQRLHDTNTRYPLGIRTIGRNSIAINKSTTLSLLDNGRNKRPVIYSARNLRSR